MMRLSGVGLEFCAQYPRTALLGRDGLGASSAILQLANVVIG
jgi:hypothetical protein